MNITAAFAVTDSSQVAEPRRAVQSLASKLDFCEERAGRAALVVSELATNLAKHARSGEVLIRPAMSHTGEPESIEILALDKGPGIPDVALSRRDGYSTAGSLGHGLGAIGRLADFFDLYTQPSGTVMLARVSRERRPTDTPRTCYEIGAAHVSKPGETICGDAWTWRLREGRLSIFVADGLGHGLQAHEAAERAVAVFTGSHESSPGRVLHDVHAALRPTRGAAIAALAVDLERGTALFAGLGNIGGTILLPEGGRHSMVSHNGTAGHSAGRIQEFTYPVPRGAIAVLCSDGVATHWNLSPYPGLTARSASVIAGVLYRDFSRRRDDVTVVVAKEGSSVSEKL